MRKHVKVATLSLAVFAGACGTSKEQTATLPDDLQKDLAAASAPASDLATAPRSFEPTRVVSEMERSKTATPEKKIVATKRHTKPVRRPQPVSKPAEVVADAEPVGTTAEAPAPTKAPDPASLPTISEPVATAPEPGARPAPTPIPTRGGSGDGGIGERRRGGGIGGLGGIFGGIIGAVVIRGGHGGVDKCDPRTDGRTGGIFIMGPNSGMPLPTGTYPRRISRQLY
ncbi:MAG TPA: hypothetical protein VF461_01150 [Gemmatimonadaceae bacterium]